MRFFLGISFLLAALAVLVWSFTHVNDPVTSSQEPAQPASAEVLQFDTPQPTLRMEPTPIPEPTTAAEQSSALATSELPPKLAAIFSASQSEPTVAGRNRALDEAVRSVGISEINSLLDALRNNTNFLAMPLTQRLVRRWAEADPSAAASWLSALPDGPQYRQAVEQVAIAWANSDLATAARWVGALPQDSGKATATIAFVYEAARTDPLTGLDAAAALPPSTQRDTALAHTVSQWAATDPQKATAWASDVADPDLRQRLISAIAVSSATRNGAAAASLVANALPAGNEQDRAAVAVVERWAQTAPRRAAEWVAQFPNTPARSAAAQNLAAVWVATDSQGAAGWVQQPRTDLKPSAVQK